MRNVGKLVWTLFLVQCAAVALLFGGYWGLKANINELKNRNRLLEQRLARADQSLKAPLMQPTQQPFIVEPIRLGKSPAQPQPTVSVAPPTSAIGTQPAAKSVADAVADTLVCVDKNTHAIVACERAASCLGLKSFDTAYFIGLKAKLGISSPMMICNMKAVEGEMPGEAPAVPSESGN